MNARPGWLTAVCVIAIVLGTLGLLGSLLGAVNMIYGEQVQQWIQKMVTAGQQTNAPPGFDDFQNRIQDRIVEIQRRWQTVNLVVMMVNLVLSSCLIFGLLFQVLKLVPTIGIQLATADIMDDLMSEMTQQATQGQGAMPPAQQRTIRTVMSTSARIGVVIGILYALTIEAVQAVCYTFGIVYLRKPYIRALYANQAGAAVVEPI
jgi:hypothetical protein